MTIRVVLADDHALFREGLVLLLRSEDDIEVAAHASDGHEAVEQAESCAPDVVVMDVSMPGMNGIEATRRIAQGESGARVLCLSMHAERKFVADVLRAGASGYVVKDATREELVRAIRELASGRKYVSPAVTGIVLEAFTSGDADEEDPGLRLLTSREREVLQLLAEGHSTKRIALSLGVSAKTVATHREHVMQKLEIESVAGLTKFAIRHGLTSLDRNSAL